MWLRIVVFIIVVAMLAPILTIIPISFTSVSFFQFPPPDYSLKWYQAFMENSNWITTFVRSLEIALFTAILSTILGTMAACAVTRINFKAKPIFMALMIAPMIIPVIIVGISIYFFFSQNHLTDTIPGLVLAHSVLAIPMVFITVTSSLRGVDRNLELAAMGLGSTPIEAFFKITVPLIKPAILSGMLISFITSLDEPVISIFITGPSTKTLPVFMWENLRTQIDPTIAVASTVIIILTICAFLLQEIVSLRASKLKNKSSN
ncbi:ABC transporter permease [Bacillus massiliigorillae]|uniref:ABC transporter permease n=1 Tax=Bacillus massiliigorillae TaxID=1243664 RepID=UPI0005A664A6|nr:ABC transporter permease [Bacillus massiliigorillae]